MTRADFYDWLINHDCKIEPLSSNTTGNAIKVIAPRNGNHIFLDLPIDKKTVKHYYVCSCCVTLGIDVPKDSEHMRQLDDHIRKNHEK